MNIRTVPVLIFLLFTSLLAQGKNILGLVVSEVNLEVDSDFERTVEISLEELIAVSLAGNTRFLQGVKIELHISNTLKKYFDSFGLSVFKKVTPEPKPGGKFFSGVQAFSHFLPFLNRIYVTIPTSASEQKSDALPVGSFLLNEPIKPEEFPILIGIIPLMKGIPNSLLDKKFFFTIKPILNSKGLLELSLQYPSGLEDESIELFIDEKQIEDLSDASEYDSGLHHLEVKSLLFKEVNATFTVEPGKTSRVEIILEEITTELSIEAPEGSEVYLDGKKMENSAAVKYQLNEGSHIVRIKIGDYSVSKRFTVKKGKSYYLSCIFDIIITED